MVERFLLLLDAVALLALAGFFAAVVVGIYGVYQTRPALRVDAGWEATGLIVQALPLLGGAAWLWVRGW